MWLATVLGSGMMGIPWPGSRYSQTCKNGNGNSDYNQMLSRLPYSGKSSAFMFYSNMKVHMNSRVGMSVFHVIISR